MTVRILTGDCRDVMRGLPVESVHCVVTSPPYWGLRDYGIVGQIGLESTPYEFVENMVEVFREVRRVLRADGTLWLNLGDCYATGAGKVGNAPGGGEQGARWRGDIDRLRDDKRGYRGERLPNGRGDEPAINRKKTRELRDGSHCGKHTAMAAKGPMTQPNRMPIAGLKPKDMVGAPWRVAFALQADGWYLRQDIIWSKPNPMPESVRDRCTKSHEYVFLLSKSERYYYDADAIGEPTVSTDPGPGVGGWASGGSDHSAVGFAKPGAPPSHGDLNKRAKGPRTRGKHSAMPRQSSGHRIVENVARARAEGSAHDNPFGATRNKRSVWTIGTQPFPEAHFATFPPALIEPCILAGCPEGGVVLDPFGGAGTTGLVADRHHRSAILIELNPEYVAMAEKRIRGDAPLFVEVVA